jgi:actin-related protein 4
LLSLSERNVLLIRAFCTHRAAQSKPSRPFEFPDGYNTYFGTIRMSVPEVLFNPSRFLPKEVTRALAIASSAHGAHSYPLSQFAQLPLPASPSTIPSHPYSNLQPIQRLVSNALVQIDPDLHSTFFSNVVVTGGTSLTQGFTDRLHSELTSLAGGMKLKIRECFAARWGSHRFYELTWVARVLRRRAVVAG